MDYIILAETFQRIESTTKRLEITDYIVDLLKKTDENNIEKVVLLMQGRIAPDYLGIELGMADKLAIKAISQIYGITEKAIEEEYQKTGDLGIATENLAKNKRQKTLFELEEQVLTVEKVFENFKKIAELSGEKSQDKKVSLLGELLNYAKPIEARYIIRTVTGKLRLGVADATILDALAIAFGETKEMRDVVERAYNIHPDLGFIAKTLLKEGIEGVNKIKVEPGIPIKVMLAERLPSLEEILEKMGGRAAFEYKYDGIRMQPHVTKNFVKIYSRRMENLTEQFPDITRAIKIAAGDHEVILDGEGVPVNIETGELLPFQAVSHRRGRKYEIERVAEEVPVVLFLFDILYLDGNELLTLPYLKRKEILESVVKENDRIKFANRIISGDKNEIRKFFEKSIEDGCEGLVAKNISEQSIYRAGAREFLWIKFKRDYEAIVEDTFDLVVVGAFAGHGQRAGTYGALLMAAYDPEKDLFVTVCKLGSGFTEDNLNSIRKILDNYKIEHRHGRVLSLIEPDYWFIPSLVLEVKGAELTLSPLHTCCMDSIEKGSGISIRFPRFTGNFRFDKKPEDATTTNEIIEEYKNQKKKLLEE
ncbi:MAG: ATP-dependent DNA ligase [Thermoplasmata archaeon]|jgi:DNA ligase-1